MMLSDIEVMDNVYEDFCKAKPNGLSELKFLQSLLENYTHEPTITVQQTITPYMGIDIDIDEGIGIGIYIYIYRYKYR